jgi:hypothetical protein
VNHTFIRVLVVVSFSLWGCGESCQINEEELNCTKDSQCDDGIYCNGFEFCQPDDPFASTYGCVAGRACNVRRIRVEDGYITGECNEGKVAACFEDGGDESTCCQGSCVVDSDCDDRQFCNGREVCDRMSEAADDYGCVAASSPCDEGGSCDEVTDSCVPACEDKDGDGFGAISCGGNDCNDNDATISPGSPEVCDGDGVDEDCDATTLGPDRDGDGYVDIDCCNGDECGADCSDTQPEVSPSATEVCNGVDDNCDGDIDETVRETFYVDADGDGFGDASDTRVGCADTIGSGYSANSGDCDDTNAQIFPGSIVCDPQPNDPNAYLFCETDGSYSTGRCDLQTEACVEQPGGHGVCTRP